MSDSGWNHRKINTKCGGQTEEDFTDYLVKPPGPETRAQRQTQACHMEMLSGYKHTCTSAAEVMGAQRDAGEMAGTFSYRLGKTSLSIPKY